MSRPNTPPSAADLARLFDRVDTLERTFKPRGPRMLGELDDVNADYPTDGQTVVYDAPLGKWKPGTAGGAGASGMHGGPVTTSIPNAAETNMDWPTLDAGTALLDLSTIDTPTVLTDGTYSFDVVVGNFGDAGVVFECTILVTDPSVPFIGVSGEYFVGVAAQQIDAGFSLTSALKAGSTVEIGCQQTSGGALDVQLVSVTVTRIA